MSSAIAVLIGPIPTITPGHARAMVLIFGSLAAVVVVGMVVEAIRRRTTLPLFCLLGSVLCNPVEPLWDVLGNLRFYHGNAVAWTAFPNLPQPIEYPYWAAFTYTLFTGVTSYLFFRMFHAAVSWHRYWILLSSMAVMNFIVEGFALTSGYGYYGYQPWRFGSDFPLWWIFTNYGELLGGALLLLLTRRYGPKANALAIVVVPSAFAGWELWTGWPMFAALGSTGNVLILNLVAWLTAAISIGTIWLIGRQMIVEPLALAAARPAPAFQKEPS
jgi:hypothetical protein